MDDVSKILGELKAELRHLDEAICSLERLAEKGVRSATPRSWFPPPSGSPLSGTPAAAAVWVPRPKPQP